MESSLQVSKQTMFPNSFPVRSKVVEAWIYQISNIKYQISNSKQNIFDWILERADVDKIQLQDTTCWNLKSMAASNLEIRGGISWVASTTRTCIAVSVFVLSFTCIYLSLTNTIRNKKQRNTNWKTSWLASTTRTCITHNRAARGTFGEVILSKAKQSTNIFSRHIVVPKYKS